MCKQYGGFHRFISRLSSFSHIFQSDASGWDRHVFLEDVYALRNDALRYPPQFEELVQHVTYNAVYPTVVLPDGDVVTRQTGNDSGKNNTASDNSIKHLIIVFQIFIEAYYKHCGEFLTLEQMLERAYVGIYSDDKLGGADFGFFGLDIDSFKSLEISVYAKHGLIIKPSSLLVTECNGVVDERHEFLGSRAEFDGTLQRYLPYPRIGKICSSVARVGLNTDLSEKEFFMKILQLTILSMPDGAVFPVLCAYLDYLIAISSNPTSLRASVNEFDMSSLTSDSILSFFLGWESQSESSENEDGWNALVDPEVNFFYSGNMEVVGFKTFGKMAARINKAEKILDNMVANCDLTSQGRAWLIMATDPFHDKQEPFFSGYPDQQVGSSICCRVQQSIQISMPPTVTTPTWSCHVVSYPWESGDDQFDPTTIGIQEYQKAGGLFWNPINNALNQAIGSLTVYNGNDGVSHGPPFINSLRTDTLSVPKEYTQGSHRIVAKGYEITNTTAPLYKQGTATVWRQNIPSSETQTGMVITTSGSPTVIDGIGPFSYKELRRPPNNVAECNLLMGTRIWEAERGAYIVDVMNGSYNPAKPADFTTPVIMWDDGTTGTVLPTNRVSVGLAKGTINPPAAGTSAFYQRNSFGMVPFHMSGAYFTGLSPQTTFTLVVNWYVERFPSPDEASIVVLTKPSASFDPIAMEFYDRMISTMPVGVPVGENGFGDWFNGVVAQIAPYVSSIGKAIGGPIGNMAATVADSVGGVAKQQRKKAKKKALKGVSGTGFAVPPSPAAANGNNVMVRRAGNNVPIATPSGKILYQTRGKIKEGGIPMPPPMPPRRMAQPYKPPVRRR
jgi:hypothetical protein